jgi:hypothetical protein
LEEDMQSEAPTAERARCVRDVLVRREVTRGSERPPLCGAADVAVVESSDLGHFNDATALGCLDDSRNRSILTEREVRPRRVIVTFGERVLPG